MKVGGYVHFPFCLRKCPYCDFTSYSGKEHLIPRYTEALKSEIRLQASRYGYACIRTIYVGGGTPNLLSPALLSDILEEIRGCFRVDEDAEITIEANPAVGIRGLRAAGANRLSLGIQSLQDNELARLGRLHTAGEAMRAYVEAKGDGFRNVSVDLMYGIPEQTLDTWRETLGRVLDMGPAHISLYSLTIEEGTPFWDMCQSGSLQLPGDEPEADMYEEAIRVLTDAGFVHYEISNFARSGFECRHNIGYWLNEPYFGFGAGATSYLPAASSDRETSRVPVYSQYTRASNVRSVEEYIRRMEAGETATESEECLTGRSAMGETMFLGLRMLRGVDIGSFVEKYGVTPAEAFGPEIESLSAQELLVEERGFLRLTYKGLLLANQVFMEFVE